MAGTAFNVTLPNPAARAVSAPIYTQLRNIVTDLEVLRVAVEDCVVLATELRTDHATFITLTSELKDDVDSTALAMDTLTQKLDGDGGITDTNYEAVHGRSGSGNALPDAVGAADISTISATAPSATNTNAAGDLVASNLTLA